MTRALRAPLAASAFASALVLALAGCWGRSAADVIRNNSVDHPASTPASTPTSTPASTPTASPPDASVPDASAPDAAALNASPALGPELPLGGRDIFPSYRLVGYCGTPGAPALGPLAYNIPAKAKALKAYADKYPDDRKTMLVFELIVVVVQSYEGADKKYRRRIDSSVIDEYLAAARQAKALLLLNIQPGQSDFMTEVKRFESYLHEPDVGIALDPEWAVKAKQKPGVFYGQTTGQTINEVAAYMASIVKEGNLPEKALVFHQLNRYVVKDEGAIVPTPGVAFIKSVDGLGPKRSKIATYNDLMKLIAPGVHAGFKLFLDEDKRIGGKVMTPAEVMGLMPKPEYVMVE